MSLLRRRKPTIKKTKADLYNEDSKDSEKIECKDCGKKNYLYHFKAVFSNIWLCRECGRKRMQGKHYTENWKKDPKIQEACRQYDLKHFGEKYCKTHRRI